MVLFDTIAHHCGVGPGLSSGTFFGCLVFHFPITYAETQVVVNLSSGSGGMRRPHRSGAGETFSLMEKTTFAMLRQVRSIKSCQCQYQKKLHLVHAVFEMSDCIVKDQT